MTHPVAERPLGVFTSVDSPAVMSENDLYGRRLGFFAGTITAQAVRDAYPELRFEAVHLETIPEIAEQLKTGGIDAFIDDLTTIPSFKEYDFIRAREIFPLVYMPVSLTTRNPEYAPLISALNKYIASGGIDRLHELYIKGHSEYVKHALYESLSNEERAYVANLSATGSKVPVVLEPDNYPVSFYNAQEKEFQGIVPDLLAEISRISGIEFEVVNDENVPWSELLAMLDSGRAALVSQLLHTGEREGKYLFSQHPYATSHYALLSRSDYPYLKMYQVMRATVGIGKDFAHDAVFKKYFPDHDNIKYYTFFDSFHL